VSRDTVRLTAAQALVRFLAAQWSERDGHRRRVIPGVFGIFGHGNVCGLAPALEECEALAFHQPRNEQAMVHAAIGYARASNLLATLACTASVGPGSTNLVTGAATATVNRVPALLLASDTYAGRRPDPVMQALEHAAEADRTREVSFWKHGNGLYTCYPHAWSPHLFYYNPAEVSTPPDSWEALLDKRFRGKVVLAKEPNDVLAKAGVATGAAKPFAMTDDEIARAKAYLVELKPNILKLAQAGAEEVRAFSEGAAVISTILGFDLRMKEAGGPEARGMLAKEGTIGFADGEMISAASKKQDLIRRFLEADFQAEWIAKRFLKYPHPFFDEKAYKLLVDQGHKELLDRLLYNRPELAFDENQVALVAPPPNQQAYTDAFNEVFGA
jgi:hypothetical protein